MLTLLNRYGWDISTNFGTIRRESTEGIRLTDMLFQMLKSKLSEIKFEYNFQIYYFVK